MAVDTPSDSCIKILPTLVLYLLYYVYEYLHRIFETHWIHTWFYEASIWLRFIQNKENILIDREPFNSLPCDPNFHHWLIACWVPSLCMNQCLLVDGNSPIVNKYALFHAEAWYWTDMKIWTRRHNDYQYLPCRAYHILLTICLSLNEENHEISQNVFTYFDTHIHSVVNKMQHLFI